LAIITRIDQIFMATETWHNNENAGTESSLNLTINVNGSDILDSGVAWETALSTGPPTHTERGNAGFTQPIPIHPISTNLLTNSSIRLGIRGDDAWAPRNVFLFGRHGDRSQVPIPLAIETDIDVWLSTKSAEGHLTMPIRLVHWDPLPEIRRVLLVIAMGWGNGGRSTNDDIELEIRGSDGTEFFREQYGDTTQADLEEYSANYYPRDVRTPFTQSDLQGCRIILRILGRDAWYPYRVFVFGFDTTSEQGRPNAIIPLAAVWDWYGQDMGGFMSTDVNEDPLEGIRDLPLVI
jgi:hypothetical protein